MILYTDIERFCCEVLRARVADGGLLPGDVWERDVRTLTVDELKPYTQVHLFCGIGASPLGLKRAGWPVELSVVTGGFPCQDISVAGKGAGIDGARSGLWKEMHRVIDIVRPRWVIAENVPALRTRGIDRVLGDLERIGYDCWPLVVGADDVGAPHRRKRVWIIGSRLDDSKGRRLRGCVRADHDGTPNRAQYASQHAGRFDVADTDDATSSAEPISVCAGGEEAKFAGSSGVADARPITLGDAGHADECGVCGFQFDHATLGKYGCPNCNGEGLGKTDATRLERCWSDARQSQIAEPQYTSGFRWPVGPGQEQHEWEAPRLTQREVGDAAHGLPGRLARAWNRHALKALGNAQVPQCVELIARAILQTESTPERSEA